MTSQQLLDWLSSHWTAAWPVVSALLIIALRSRTPEQWVALGETSPRWQGVVRLLRAVGLDPAKALSALAQIVTGRAPARAVQIADTIAPVDPSKVPAPVPREGERGFVTIAALALVLCVAALLAGIAHAGGIVGVLGALALCLAAVLWWRASARPVGPLRYPAHPSPRVASAPHGSRAGGMAMLSVICLVVVGCPPVPPSDGGTPVVTPSGWSQTARLAVTVGRGLLPVAGAIVEATTQDPGRTQARRAFVVADDALAGLGRALDAYDARGGDRCAAYAAAGAAGAALAELADVLAANGIALGVPLGRVVDLVASVVDTLVPQCQLDADFASAGRAANERLLTIERGARSRGVILRRDLDAIDPRLDGGVR